MHIVTVDGLTFRYPNSESAALDNVSLDVDEGAFFVLCGFSGSGKSTLLRHLKPELTPHGRRCGKITFRGRDIASLDPLTSASSIGFVGQSPEDQIVTDKVWHELAFGLESLGLDSGVIRRRVAETASFFGIEELFFRDTAELSGGQKQLVNLASVMAMQPELLVLDEPTSRLDPTSASEFLLILQKINRELGVTVILAEQSLEGPFAAADGAAVMDRGRIVCAGKPAYVGETLFAMGHAMTDAMPASVRIWGSAGGDGECPVTVAEGRAFLKRRVQGAIAPPAPASPSFASGTEAVSVRDVDFGYGEDAPDVLRRVSLTSYEGEFLCILGGNGAGKSTLLKLMAGILEPRRGEIVLSGKAALLPQDPRALFIKRTVRDELLDAAEAVEQQRRGSMTADIAARLGLDGLLDRHPYDLSGGEQQRCAIAKLLLREPRVLLLDEPTKGFDVRYKAELYKIIRELTRGGVAVVAVSHDVEFCARYADRCAMLFGGQIAADAPPREFFAGNAYYTTAANRISRGIADGCVTTEDVIRAIGGELPRTAISDAEIPPEAEFAAKTAASGGIKAPRRLPKWRKIAAILSAACAFLTFVYAERTGSLYETSDAGAIEPLGKDQLIIYGILLALLLLTAAFLYRGKGGTKLVRREKDAGGVPKRTWAAAAVVLILVPLTLAAGLFFLDTKQYYVTATAVLLECMAPFFIVFEGRRPRSRELVVIAVLCALGIAGRVVFAAAPQFKPVLAIAIIAGVTLGGETGFLVGSLVMLVSNMMFSQGPWTPWQMFAAGIVGFLAGVLCEWGVLRRTRLSLCLFGALSAVLIYGGIMNPVSALIWIGGAPDPKIILGYYVTGLPMDVIHAAATAVFLWFISEPMIETLDRVREKYGLLSRRGDFDGSGGQKS